MAMARSDSGIDRSGRWHHDAASLIRVVPLSTVALSSTSRLVRFTFKYPGTSGTIIILESISTQLVLRDPNIPPSVLVCTTKYFEVLL